MPISSGQSETHSETLSTSTALSRAEDVSRMRDVEDSMDERYYKVSLNRAATDGSTACINSTLISALRESVLFCNDI